MKSSILVVVFAILVVVLGLKWGMKTQLLSQISYTRIAYNQLVDSALEDGLDAGTAFDSTSFPVVDEEVAIQAFQESLLKGFDLHPGTTEAKRLLSCIGCIVILQNQYFSLVTEEGTLRYPYRTQRGNWNIDFAMDGKVCCEHRYTKERHVGMEEEIREIIGFPISKSKDTTFTWKNQVVTECVEQAVEKTLGKKYKDKNYTIDFPTIEEDSCHTLQGISMLSFMQYAPFQVDGYSCNRFTLSGARLIYKDLNKKYKE